MKLAFIFPGQGSQKVEMGKDFFEKYESSRKIYNQANEVLHKDIAKMCFEGPEEELKITYNTQPSILTTSIAILSVLTEMGLKPNAVAGHSLGEYSALVAANVMDFSYAVKAVEKRGQFMEAAVPAGKGTMSAILGLDKEKVNEACKQAAELGVVAPANYNCPGQIVIAGEVKAVEKANELAMEMGAKRATMLNVSGPFHSSMLKGAGEKLYNEVLTNINFREPEVDFYANVTANQETKSQNIKSLLKEQVFNTVKWDEIITNMIDNGVTLFVEIGPGSVLKGLNRKIDKTAKTFNISNLTQLDKFLEYAKENGLLEKMSQQN